jgi:hypothetical protein
MNNLNKRNKRILLGAIGAGVSVMFLFKILGPDKGREFVQVVEVKSTVHKAEQIKPSALMMKQISKSEYQPWMIKNMSDVTGSYATTDLFAGDELRNERVSKRQVEDDKPDDRTINLAMELPKLGGIPNEGDRADVIAYFPPPEKNMGVGYSELVLQNVYIDKIITKDWKEVNIQNESNSGDKKTNKDEEKLVPAIVTLKVSVEDSLVLTTLQSNKDVVLRLVGRTDKSKDVDIKARISDQLRLASQVGQR